MVDVIDTKIGQISVETAIDFSGMKRDLAKLEAILGNSSTKMSASMKKQLNSVDKSLNRRSLGVDVSVNDAELDQLEGRLDRHKKPTNLKVNVDVDDSSLTRLNDHIDIKIKHIGVFHKYLKSKPIKPIVDDNQLKKLFKDVESIKRSTDKLNTYSRSNPISVKVDDREIKSVQKQIKTLLASAGKIRIDAEASFKHKGTMAALKGGRLYVDHRGIERRLDKLISLLDRSNDYQKVYSSRLVGAIKASSSKMNIFQKILQLPMNMFESLGRGLFETIAGTFGSQIGKGMADYLEKKTGKDPYSMGKSSARFMYGRSSQAARLVGSALHPQGLKGLQGEVTKLIKKLDDITNPSKMTKKYTELGLPTVDFTKFNKNLSTQFDKLMTMISFKIGDVIAAPINKSAKLRAEDFVKEDGTLKDLSTILKDGLNIEALDALVKELKDFSLVTDAIDDFVDSFNDENLPKLNFPDYKGKGLSGLGQIIETLVQERRRKGAEFRAIPEVKRRVRQIMEEEKPKRNSGRKLNEEHDTILITVGGYAAAQGRSSARFPREIPSTVENFPKETTKIIYVFNEESDIRTGEVGDINAEIAGSLAKPNLKGYNPDAIEMVAQAIAAKKTNPNIKIRLMGESGGGFISEEAAMILNMMGIEDVESISVGTPKFAGDLNVPNNKKIISGDERIGDLVAKFLPQMSGLVDQEDEGQNLLGQPEHISMEYAKRYDPDLLKLLGVEAFVKEWDDFRIGKFKELLQARLHGDEENNLEDIHHEMQIVKRGVLDTGLPELKQLAEEYEKLFAYTTNALSGADIAYERLELVNKLIQYFKSNEFDVGHADEAIAELDKVIAIAEGFMETQAGTPYKKAKDIKDTATRNKQTLESLKKKNTPKVEQEKVDFATQKKTREEIELEKESQLIAEAITKSLNQEQDYSQLQEAITASMQSTIELISESMTTAIVESLTQNSTSTIENIAETFGNSLEVGNEKLVKAIKLIFPKISDTIGESISNSLLSISDGIGSNIADGFNNKVNTGEGDGGAGSQEAEPALVGVMRQQLEAAFNTNTQMMESMVERSVQLVEKSHKMQLDRLTSYIEAVRERTKDAVGQGGDSGNIDAIQTLQKETPGLIAQIDKQIQALDPADRMKGEGAKLANAKSQAVKLEKKLEKEKIKAEKAISKEKIETEKKVAKIKEESFPEFVEQPPEPTKEQKEAIGKKSQYAKMIEAMGTQFSEDYSLLNKLKKERKELLESDPSADVSEFDEIIHTMAQTIVSGAEKAYEKIKELEQKLGKGKTRYITSKSGIAKGKITTAKNKAQKILDLHEEEGRSAGEAIGDGMTIGVQEKYAQLAEAAERLGEIPIEIVEQVLGIQSPSKEMMKRGIYIVQGLIKGVKSKTGTLGSVVKTLAENISKEIIAGVINTSGKIANARQKSSLKKAMPSVLSRAAELIETLEPADPKIKSHVISTGGYAGMKGESSPSVAKQIQTMLGKSFHVDSVKNKATDTSVAFDKPLKFIAEAFTKLVINEIVKGVNPDAIEMAAMAIARSHQTGKPVDMVGYSAGGLVVRQAQKMAKIAGVGGKGIGIGTPLLAHFEADIEEFIAFLGETDLLGSLHDAIGKGKEANQQMLSTAGKDHHLHNYLGSREFQQAFYKFLGKGSMRPSSLDTSLYEADNIQPFGDSSAKGVGENISQGVAEGIISGGSEPIEAITILANEIIESAEEELEIESPSGKGIDIGINIAKGIARGLKDGLKYVGKSATDLAQKGIDKLGERLQEKDNIDIKGDSGIPVLDSMVKGIEEGLQITMKNMDEFLKFVPDLAKGVNTLFKSMLANPKAVTELAKGVILLNAVIIPLFKTLFDLQTVGYEIAAQLQDFERVILFSSGVDGAENIKRVRVESEKLGTSLIKGFQGMAQLAASARATALEGQGVQELFSVLNKTAAVYGLTSEKQDQVYRATSQMIDKQVISMEELRGQLSEALPGAMAIAARSMGMGIEEFQKFVGTGELMAEDFLPKFTQQLESELSLATIDPIKNATQAMNMFENSLTRLQEKIGVSSMFYRNIAFVGLAKGIDFLSGSLNNLFSLLMGITVGILRDTLASTLKISLSLINIPATISTIKSALISLYKFLKPFIKQFIVVKGVFDLVGLISKATVNQGQNMQSFANQTSNALDKLTGKSEEAKRSFLGLAEALSNIKAPTLADDTILGEISKGILGEDVGGGLIKGLERELQTGKIGRFLAMLSPAGLPLMSRSVATGKNPFTEGFTTQAEKVANDLVISASSFNQSINELFSATYGLLGVEGMGVAELKELQELDAQLSQIQAKRRARDLTDEDRQELIRQERSILELRQKSANVVGGYQSQLTFALQNLKESEVTIERQLSLLEDAPEAADEVELLNRELEAVKENIEEGEKLQELLNKAIKGSVDSFRDLRLEMNLVLARMEDLKRQSQKLEAVARENLASMQMAGVISEGDVRIRELLNSQEALGRQLQINEEAAAALRSQLESPRIADTLLSAGLDPSQGAAQLRTNVEFITEGQDETDFTKILQEAADKYEQLANLEVETAELRASIAESGRDARLAIVEAERSIREFYREIQDSSEDIKAEIASTKLETSITNAQNKIRSAVTQLNNRFFGDFINGIVDLFDMLFEPLRKLNDAQNQIRGIDRNMRDLNLRAAELARTTPTGTTGTQIGQSVAGKAFGSGLFTGPSSTIGGSSAYHIDTKIARSLPWEDAVRMFDQMAVAYREVGKRIEFSNSAVSGLIYDENAALQEKIDLLKKVDEAHSHSVHQNFRSFDYYVPDIGESRHGSTAQGVEMLLPSIEGGSARFGTAANYGNFANILDAAGNIVFKTGHGDNRQALPSNREFAAMATDLSSIAGNASSMANSGVPLTPAAGNMIATSSIAGMMSGMGGSPLMSLGQSAVSLERTISDFTVKGVAATDAQIANARIIAEVGKRMGANEQEIAGAIATAIQESTLVNLPGGDKDSQGLFQQRASMDWGTPVQIQNAEFAAESFFGGRGTNQGLLDTVGTDIFARSHQVQRSAHPEAPRQWAKEGERFAAAFVDSALIGIAAPGAIAAPSNIGLIDQGLSQSSALAEEQKGVIMDSLEAQNNALAVEFDRGILNARESLRRGSMELEQAGIDVSRQRQDLENALLRDSPVKTLLDQLVGTSRELQDQYRTETETLREARRGLEELTNMRDQLEGMAQTAIDTGASAENVDKIIGLIPAVDAAIAASQQEVEALEGFFEDMNDQFAARDDALITQFERQQRQEALPAILEQMRLENRKLEALDLEFAGQFEQTQLLFDAEIAALEKTRQEGRLTEEQYIRLREAIVGANSVNLSNLAMQQERQRIQIENEIAQANLSFLNEVNSSRTNLMNAQADSMIFDEFGANRIKREAAQMQENMRFLQEMQRIAELEQQLRLESDMSDEDIASNIGRLRTEAEQLNQLNLESARQQFKTLGHTLRDQVHPHFQSFFRGIFDAIGGEGSIGDAFKGLADSILNTMFDLAAKLLTDKLFGALFGQDGAGGGFFSFDSPIDPNQTQADIANVSGVEQMAQSLNTTLPQQANIASQAFAMNVESAAFRFNQIISQGSPGALNNIVPFQSGLGNSIGLGGNIGDGGLLTSGNPIGTAGPSLFGSVGSSIGLEAASSFNVATDLTQPATEGAAIFGQGLGGVLPSILQSVLGMIGGGGGGGFGSILGSIGSIFGGLFANGGMVGLGKYANGGMINQGVRGKDETLILAQRGEGILSHKGMAALGGANALAQLNKGMAIGRFASGGTVGNSLWRNRADIGLPDISRSASSRVLRGDRETGPRETRFNFQSEVINNREYVSRDQLDQLENRMNERTSKASDRGAQKALFSLRNSMSARRSVFG